MHSERQHSQSLRKFFIIGLAIVLFLWISITFALDQILIPSSSSDSSGSTSHPSSLLSIFYPKLDRQQSSIDLLYSELEKLKLEKSRLDRERKELQTNTEVAVLETRKCFAAQGDGKTKASELEKKLFEFEHEIRTLETNIARLQSDRNQSNTEISEQEEEQDADNEIADSPMAWKEKFELVSPYEKHCRDKLGMQHISNWKKATKDFCKPSSSSFSPTNHEYDSRFRCRVLEHNGKPNAWCDGFNLYIAPSKITREPKQFFHEFYNFKHGAIGVKNCAKDMEMYGTINGHTFRHNSDTFANSLLELEEQQPKCTHWIEHPVYFAKRYEYYNLYHTTTEWGNAWMAMKVLGIKREEMQLVFLDYHEPFSTLDIAWRQLFSPNHPVLRVEDLKSMANEAAGERLCLRHAIFGLVGYLGFMHTSNDHPTVIDECHNSELVQSFSNYIMSVYDGVLEQEPSNNKKLVITLVVRRDYKKGQAHADKVERKFRNEEQIIELLKSASNSEVHVADFSEMSFEDQVRLMRKTNVLIGVHGAGMTNLMYLPEQAIVVEISTRKSSADLYFRNIAQWMGKTFVSYGTFNKFAFVDIDVADFKVFLEPIFRMARQTFNKFEECGFTC